MSEWRYAGIYMWIVFAVMLLLKLTKTVDTSWWIVCLPIYLPIIFFMLMISIAWMGHRFK